MLPVEREWMTRREKDQDLEREIERERERGDRIIHERVSDGQKEVGR